MVDDIKYYKLTTKDNSDITAKPCNYSFSVFHYLLMISKKISTLTFPIMILIITVLTTLLTLTFYHGMSINIITLHSRINIHYQSLIIIAICLI